LEEPSSLLPIDYYSFILKIIKEMTSLMIFSPVLDKNSSIALYIQLYEYIKLEIKTGLLKPDSKLPSIREASTTLKLSKTTIENAYSQLVAEGYIDNMPKKGYFVCDLTDYKCKENLNSYKHNPIQSPDFLYINDGVDNNSFEGRHFGFFDCLGLIYNRKIILDDYRLTILDNVNKFIEKNCYINYVLELNHKIIGFVITKIQNSECWIMNVGIDKEHQRQHWGRQLMEHVFAEPVSLFWLEVRVSNKSAISLYKNLGFVEIARRKEYYPGDGKREDALVMRKRL